jgi:2-(1,2-epoxy-1,2-dihydrophenyl)acetyl-CoA isomerase
MKEAQDPETFLRDLSRAIHRSVLQLRGMPKPTVAGVNGMAVGAGLGLVLACDISVAVEDAQLRAGFTGFGLAPGCGSWFYPGLMGYHRACEFVFLETPLTAAEARGWGMVNYSVPPGEYRAKLEEITGRLASGPTLAFGRAKELLNMSLHNTLESHLERESLCVCESGGTEDFREGITALNEKRKPSFRGK